MFGKRRSWRDSEKGEETIQIIRRRWNEMAIPFHHVGCFAQLVEHWAAVDRVDRMQLECKRSDDAKIAAAAAKRPEQIRIFVGGGFHKFAVRQDDISREQIIDAQTAFAGEMTDAAAPG